MKREAPKKSRVKRKNETEPNRTRQENDNPRKATSGKRVGAGIAPAKVKAEPTNNPPAIQKRESSDRRSEKGGRGHNR